MRQLLSSGYVPFGSQYYRAPSPPPEDWARDLEAMAAQGFTMVKFWLQWRWNHPEENRFDFSDIDRLMDLAGENGLRVMLNTIVDVAPAWIYRRYPDASMVTRDGWHVGPQTQPHRQIGGLGLSLFHDEAQAHLFEWLRAAIERYRDHPALEIWNVGSEPELTQSMAELRRWADDADRMGDALDHHPRAVAAFRDWLRAKYGTIEALNHVWNRNYASFDEAEVPQTRNTFGDVVDWRMFFVHALGEHLRRRFDVARDADGGRHPLMCHHVFIQGFPVTATASDPWNAGQFGDLHGITQMDDPMMCDVLRCCARGRPVISAEMLMLLGYTLDLPKPRAMRDVKRHVFTGLAAGLKGFLFWQYRPETLGREAPTWGLTHLDGSTTPFLDAFAEVGRVLQQHADLVLDAEPPRAKVAVLYSPENQIFGWAATGNEKTATDSILGVHAALYEAGHVVDLVHPWDFARTDALDGYRVIVVPFPYHLSREIAARLKAWVEQGGVLVAEAYCGGWHAESGRHATTIPGYGLHEVFGVRQQTAEPAVTDAIEMTTVVDLPGLPKGHRAHGLIARETYALEGAEPLATYAEGQPAITRHTYGRGQAILVGTYAGLYAHRTGDADTRQLFAALVESAVALVRPTASGARLRADVITAGQDALVVVRNLEDASAEGTVRLPVRLPEKLEEIFGQGDVSSRTDGGQTLLRVSMDAEEVRVYRARLA